MIAVWLLPVIIAVQAAVPQGSSPPAQPSIAPAALTGTIRVAAMRLPDGGWNLWDVPIDRARSLPRWNPESDVPPLAMQDAIRLARAWLTVRNPQLPGIDLQSIGMTRIRRGAEVDTWCYQVDFFASGPSGPAGPLMKSVVLLDGTVMDPRVEPARPADAAPSPDAVFTIGAPGVTAPRLLGEARPHYRAEAMRQKIEGYVMVECVVSIDGKPTDCQITHSLDPLYGLDEEALIAARQWRFAPGTKDGKPVPVRVTMQMTFTLRK